MLSAFALCTQEKHIISFHTKTATPAGGRAVVASENCILASRIQYTGHIYCPLNMSMYTLRFLNGALWYTYVIRTNKMHTFDINGLI